MKSVTGPFKYHIPWTPFDEEMAEAVVRPLRSGPILYDGPETKAFEEEVARYLGVEHGVAVSSGSAALHLAFIALGLGPGDEVLMPANSYIGAPESVLHVGATPTYCDVDARTANPSLELLLPYVTPRTRAIVVFHMYGNPVDMGPILGFARERGLYVVEDFAHALGGEYEGRKLGSLGDINITSFARKCITVGGQGGMVVTNDADLAYNVYRMKRHGWDWENLDRGSVAGLGYNYTMNECQAAVGRVQLPRVDRYRDMREQNARYYTEGLCERQLPAVPFEAAPWGKHGRLHYVVKVDRRDELVDFLHQRGIGARVLYDSPVYRNPLYVEKMGYDPGPRPVTDRLVEQIVALPGQPNMRPADIDYVLDNLEEFFSQ